jgi:hypothetical protein
VSPRCRCAALNYWPREGRERERRNGPGRVH